MKVDRKLIILAISSVVVLVLGSIAFYQNDSGQGWLTAVYKAIQLFSMNSGVLDEGEPTPVLLEFARWLALGTLLAVVFSTIQALIGHLLRIAFSNGHIIVCGVGQRGEVIARAHREIGKSKVIVVEIDDKNPSLGELRNLGIDIVIGNALDASVLESARISTAKALIAVTGSDQKNLAICKEVRDQFNSKCDLTAGLESWAWRNFFRDRMGKKRITLNSYLSRATINLMHKMVAKKAAVEPRMRSSGVHIIIEASGQRQHELIRAAVLMLQISGDQKPVVEITGVSPEQQEAFLDCFPAAALVADLRWHQSRASLTFPEGAKNSPGFAIFSLDSDIETLEAAERFWMRHETPSDHIIACLDGDDGTANLVSNNKEGKYFEVINLIEQGLDKENLTEHPFEKEAKICHAVYYETEIMNNGNSKHPEDWNELDETFKESNRFAAMQNIVAGIMWKSRGDIPGKDMLTHLARCEHMRWMAEKAMHGWRWSGSKDSLTRNDNKLKHHSLFPFEELTPHEKDKDYGMLLWSLDIKDSELAALALDKKTSKLVLLGRSVRARFPGVSLACEDSESVLR
jgi:hypothetical protein